MTPEQIQLVQSTWTKVRPIQETAAQLFYDRLFELDPSLKALFRGDIHEQGKKLMQVLDGVVMGLSQIDRLEPIVRQLGQRHVGYGVKDQHYVTVGEALLWTLGRVSRTTSPKTQGHRGPLPTTRLHRSCETPRSPPMLDHNTPDLADRARKRLPNVQSRPRVKHDQGAQSVLADHPSPRGSNDPKDKPHLPFFLMSPIGVCRVPSSLMSIGISVSGEAPALCR
jgi:hemoglobin-like flavoprotein